MNTDNRIKFMFTPSLDGADSFVEKSDESGKKRRYISGIASGSMVDGHGERITEKAIRDMQDQAGRGDILLFADRHGISMTDDIGKLVRSSVKPDGDWFTEWRLYDEGDGVGNNTLERANKLWKQLNGFPPYTKKHQRGFSVEGFIPDDGIIQMNEQGKRIIDKVVLDGCVVVPRPAYQTSIAHSIYKALGETSPWVIKKEMSKMLTSKLAEKENSKSYYKTRNDIDDSLDDKIEEIMAGDKEQQGDLLQMLFSEYGRIMTDLVLNKYPTENKNESNSGIEVENSVAGLYKSNRQTVLKSLINELERLENNLHKES